MLDIHRKSLNGKRFSRGGAQSRRKGNRAELALVRLLQSAGFAAEKCSRTGYSGPDLSVPLLGVDRRVEVKVRGDGFRQLYAWLAGADLLIVRADRREPLVILPLKFAVEIAAAAERARGSSS
jgi:Holliday junction resolvase